MDEFEYSETVMQFFGTDEGRVVWNNTATATPVYEYTIKDHLGNARVNFTFDATTGKAKVVQANDYYPFGLAHAGGFVSGLENKYQYNGKEKLDDLGLNWYDYGVRMYDAELARWHTMDPIADSTTGWSPYAYVFNSPVAHIDPDGRTGIAVIDHQNHTITVHAKYVFYGSQATTDLSRNIANEIAHQYNSANGTVDINGVTYTVRFQIRYETVTEAQARQMAQNNTSAEVNFMRVEKTNRVHGRSFNVVGTNAGFLNTDDGLGWSTTAPHEAGHGFGLVHSGNKVTIRGTVWDDIRGQGRPDIMAARGALVDAPYQNNPNVPAATPGGTVDATKRKVTQKNITDMFKNVTFGPDNKANIGGNLTNKIYNQNGQ
jgi:RHS repeat-associated protein